jgi:hypothetical protein
MPRSQGRIVNLFGKIVIVKKNPWYHPDMLSILAKIGKVPRKPQFILAQPPPWFGNPAKLSREQYERCKLFSIVASQTANMKLKERLVIISQRLKTGRKERKPRIKEKKFHELYPTYEALTGKAEVAPATTVAPVVRE